MSTMSNWRQICAATKVFQVDQLRLHEMTACPENVRITKMSSETLALQLSKCPPSGMPEAMRQSKYTYYDEVEGDHVVQKPWHHQDQNTRNQSYQRFVRQVRKVHCTSPFQTFKDYVNGRLIGIYWRPVLFVFLSAFRPCN